MKWIKQLFRKKTRINSDWERIINYKSDGPVSGDVKKLVEEPNWDEIRFDEYEDISAYPLSRLSESARCKIIDIIRQDIGEQVEAKSKAIERMVIKDIKNWTPTIELSKL